MSGSARIPRPKSFAEAVTAIGGTCLPPAVVKWQVEQRHLGHDAQEAARSPANQPNVDAQIKSQAPKPEGPSAEMQALTLKFAHVVGDEAEEMALENGKRIYGQDTCWTDQQTAREAMALAIRGSGIEDETALSPAGLESQARAYADWVAESYVYYGYVSQAGEAVHHDAPKPEKDAMGKEIDKIVETGEGLRAMAKISRDITLGIAFAGAVSGSAVSGADFLMKRTIILNEDELNEGRAPVPTSPTNPHVVSAYAVCAGHFETLSKYLAAHEAELGLATRDQILVRAEALFRSQAIQGRVQMEVP
ncbi:MAG: hypothetical protein ACI9MR_003303 [Myxococcota bacterium]|jgi:hypothetical protein